MQKRVIRICLIMMVFLTVIAFTNGIFAQEVEEVRIGAVYPLSGPIAVTGLRCRYAVETAMDIVNNYHDIDLPLARTEGLPNLDGAMIDAIFGDSEASPEVGRAEAERLIDRGVHALIGSYQSAVSKTGSSAAERARIPWMCGASSSAALTDRGYNWFFRYAPTDREDSEIFMEFLDYVNGQGHDVNKVALVYENTEFGKHAAMCAEEAAERFGYEVVADVPYTFGSTSLDSELLTLRAAEPDAVIAASLVGDFILFVETSRGFDFNTQGVLSFCGGFQDPGFVDAVGSDGDYYLGTDSFGLDLTEVVPELDYVNQIFKDLSGANFDGPVFNIFNAALTLFEAIDRAGSTEPDAIRQALTETDLELETALANRVVFGDDGHNIYASSVIQQTINERYRIVYPEEFATADLVWPMPTWDEK